METEQQKIDKLCLKHNCSLKKILKEEDIDSTMKEMVESRLAEIAKAKKVIKKLQKIQRIEQKSEEWYKVRNDLITASDFAQALGKGKFGNADQILKKKVQPSSEDAFSGGNIFFAWGNMFEPVANDIYSKLHHNVTIHEFGLLKHPKLDFFGASPDGISDVGVMLEIKCPYKRKIESGSEVPTQYYYQIQGQLEVCGLKECDYFECQFQMYDGRETFYRNYSNDCVKGAIIVYFNEQGNKAYKYSPIVMGQYTNTTNQVSQTEFEGWVDEHLTEDCIEVKYWYLNTFNLQRVSLDKQFVDEKLKELGAFWKRVLHYRQNPDRFQVEVLKQITIDGTPTVRQQQPTTFEKRSPITGYSFIDDPDE